MLLDILQVCMCCIPSDKSNLRMSLEPGIICITTLFDLFLFECSGWLNVPHSFFFPIQLLHLCKLFQYDDDITIFRSYISSSTKAHSSLKNLCQYKPAYRNAFIAKEQEVTDLVSLATLHTNECLLVVLVCTKLEFKTLEIGSFWIVGLLRGLLYIQKT